MEILFKTDKCTMMQSDAWKKVVEHEPKVKQNTDKGKKRMLDHKITKNYQD